MEDGLRRGGKGRRNGNAGEERKPGEGKRREGKVEEGDKSPGWSSQTLAALQL